MTDQILTDFVITQLGDGAERDDIIFELCEKTQMRWPAAEALFEEIERSHHREIARRKNTLLLTISALILAEGIGQVLWAFFPFLDIVRPLWAGGRGQAPLWASLAALPGALYLYGSAFLLGLLTTFVAGGSIVCLANRLREE